MARAAKIPPKSGTVHEDGEAAAKAGHNGFDPDKLRKHVDAYDDAQAEIDKIMTEARKDCQPYKDQQKDIKKEAALNHIPKEVFAVALKERRLLAKAAAAADSLNDAQKETLDQVKHALGMLDDTPLGKAALDKHPETAAEKLAEKAYDRGYAAGGTPGGGVKVETNPFEEGTDQHEQWKEGFLARQSEIAAEMAPEPEAASAE